MRLGRKDLVISYFPRALRISAVQLSLSVQSQIANLKSKIPWSLVILPGRHLDSRQRETYTRFVAFI
jgi:hypothetical protein